MITIDGTTYNVPVKRLKRNVEFLDKYAERLNDGSLRRELIGVYHNYQLQFGKAAIADYEALHDKLVEATEFHTVIIPTTVGNLTFQAYFSSIEDELIRVKGSVLYWMNLKVNFISKEPTTT